jgi:predicted TIM-barrel fold metal-dependent hydrolase
MIDAHTHVWRATDESAGTKTIVSSTCDVPAELLDQYLTEYGVERAVLIQPAFMGEDNDYVAECAARLPQRFAAVCVVDPRHPSADDRLGYWVGERGCKGLRLRPRMSGEAEAFGSPHTYPLWESVRERGIVVSIYAGPEHLATLTALATRFPEVAIVVDHMAHPSAPLGADSQAFRNLLALARFPRVFIKVSAYYHFSEQAYPYPECWPLFRALYDGFGPSRLLWGSDFPHVLLRCGYRRSLLLQERAYAFLGRDELALVMGGNAAALYWGRNR